MEATTSSSVSRGIWSRLENRNTLNVLLAVALAATYAGLFYVKSHSHHGPPAFAVGSTVLRMALDMCVVAFAYSLYFSGRASSRSMFPLMAAFIFAAVIQIIYGACVQVLGIHRFGHDAEIAMVFLHLGFLLNTCRFLAVARREKFKGLRWITIGLSILVAGSFVLVGKELFGSLSQGSRIDPICAAGQLLVLIGLAE